MDTSKLVVGQEVDMVSGCYAIKGKVIKVTPSGVDVQSIRWGVSLPDGVYSFDANGKGCDGRSTYECGPWDLQNAGHQ